MSPGEMMPKCCTRCGTEKNLDGFGKSQHSKDGLRSCCKACLAELQKIYQYNHKDVMQKYLAEHKESISNQAKKWHEENKDRLVEYRKRYRAENKEKLAESDRIRWKNNPEKSRIYRQKRKANKQQVASTLTVFQWDHTRLYFNNSCAYCGKARPLTQDHFIALSRLGEYSHDNIVPVCQSCNSSKWTSSFFVWYPKQPFYSRKRESRLLKFLHYENQFQQLSLVHGEERGMTSCRSN